MLDTPQPVPPSQAAGRARLVARALATYAVIGGAAGVVGWVFGERALTDWADTGISMQPNTGIAALLIGTAILALSARAFRLAGALAAMTLAIGLAALYENFAGVRLPHTGALLFDRPWGARGTSAPGVMGIPAAVSWTLLGAAVVAESLGRGRRRIVPLIALLVAVIGSAAIVGYLLGADQLYTLTRRTAIALQTATVVLAAALGVVALGTNREPMLTLLDDGAVGPVGRRLLGSIVLLAVLLGTIVVLGLKAGLYDDRMGTALLMIGLTSMTAAVLWWSVRDARLREQHEHQRRDEFLATLAHELRNPLAPMSNAAHLLSRVNRGDPVGEQATATISRQVRHMVRLIDDLLDISRISRNKLVLQQTTLDLLPLVRQAIDAARPVMHESRLAAVASIPEGAAWVSGDPDRLAQVFGNLLNNACKFTPAGGTITVTVTRTDTAVQVFVADTGIGIPPTMLERVFDAFVQVDDSLERSHGGLGIGLNLVRQLVTMHGGTAVARSDGPGHGTTVEVRFPLADQPPPPTREAPHAAAVPSPLARRVLVVDDNRDAADSLAMMLRLAGSRAIVAYHGADALDALSRELPDIMLLDIGLPGMSGYDVCRAARSLPGGGTVRIFALTGWGQPADREAARLAGFDGHLIKPADHDTLFSILAGRDIPW
jgi:signal transduction histidine kinase